MHFHRFSTTCQFERTSRRHNTTIVHMEYIANSSLAAPLYSHPGNDKVMSTPSSLFLSSHLLLSHPSTTARTFAAPHAVGPSTRVGFTFTGVSGRAAAVHHLRRQEHQVLRRGVVRHEPHDRAQLHAQPRDVDTRAGTEGKQSAPNSSTASIALDH